MKLGQHQIRRIVVRLLLALLVILAGGAALIYLRFRFDTHAAEQRVAAGSKLANTPCGTIEYGEHGTGQVVLALHGAGGGYDQGLLFADALGDGFRVIAPSRFGYLNSPIPEDGSVAAQAKAYACLLDSLDIDHAAVIAASAGGPSALQFALDYPDRVDALVLVSAVSTLRPIRDESSGPSTAMLTDFVYWLAATAMPDTVLGVLGLPPESLTHLSANEHNRVIEVLNAMMSMSRRLPGMELDAVEQARTEVETLPIENITAPTLVVHATDDALVPFAQGQYSADHIQNARLFPLEYGGHFAFVLDSATAEIKSFLNTHNG
jgi:pimeloyl-ACP methyl ester carboxylesterase